MENGKTFETLILPKELIQHIQSFMSGKEAARTTILSKSWHAAWLTRPTLDFNEPDFCGLDAFDEFTKKTMQRYVDTRLKIDSLRLRDYTRNHRYLIVDAMKMGATRLQLRLLSMSITLPEEVLGCQTLLGLDVYSGEIGGEYTIRCSRLKSLGLMNVKMRNERFKDIMNSCSDSLEKLSLFYPKEPICFPNIELHKLRRLHLFEVAVDSMFFDEFGSRFPCLNDLTIDHCRGYNSRIHIASTSLRNITFNQTSGGSPRRAMPMFKVPNVRRFTHMYSDLGTPARLSIKGASRKWQLDMSIVSYTFPKLSWFLGLKKSLTKYRASRITLCIELRRRPNPIGECSDHDAGVEAMPTPVAVESLKIVIDESPTPLCYCLVRRLFGICRPKFVTFISPTSTGKKCSSPFDVLCERVMYRVMTLDRDLFGQFGLKKVTVPETKVSKGGLYEVVVTMVRFEVVRKD